ncbi:MAG TPA: zinc-dependent metalloprotease, partial [Candidatus Limnocylindrales bacterium]|nr:zinc-dependent metalloprotease [Candidatus Limnocylindrales bacterium]
AERLERQLALFSGSASTLGRDAMRALGRTLRGGGTGEHWLERLMGDEQRRLFRETQAVMSLLEGFSDFVMDEVGRGLVPDVERISARFHERRQQRSGFERAVLRLTGMDLKMEQYARGERFVRAIAEARGRPALARMWEGPQTLPTAEEIAEPGRWMARVLDARTPA